PGMKGGIALDFAGGSSDSLAVVHIKPQDKDKAKVQLKLIQEAMAGKAEPSLEGLTNAFGVQTVPLNGGPPGPVTNFDLRQPININMMLMLSRMVEPPSLAVNRMVILKEKQILMPTCQALAPDGKTLAIGGFLTGADARAPHSALLLWDLE